MPGRGLAHRPHGLDLGRHRCGLSVPGASRGRPARWIKHIPADRSQRRFIRFDHYDPSARLGQLGGLTGGAGDRAKTCGKRSDDDDAAASGGQMPGTAQLAPTASSSRTPLAASKITRSPVRASTAVICNRPAGHSKAGSLDSITLRLDCSDSVLVLSASAPTRIRATSGFLDKTMALMYLASTLRPIFA